MNIYIYIFNHLYNYIFIYMHTNKYIYMFSYLYILYVYLYVQEHRGPTGLLFLWWPSASIGGFAPPLKKKSLHTLQNIQKH